MRIKRIHRILQFHQTDFLNAFVTKCTGLLLLVYKLLLLIVLSIYCSFFFQGWELLQKLTSKRLSSNCFAVSFAVCKIVPPIHNFSLFFTDSSFGKFIQSPLRYLEAKFVSDSETFEKVSLSPFFQGIKFINDKLSVCIMKPKQIEFNRPTAVWTYLCLYSSAKDLPCWKFLLAAVPNCRTCQCWLAWYSLPSQTDKCVRLELWSWTSSTSSFTMFFTTCC